MRRATKMTLLVMGGSAVTLGTISLAQHGHANGCQGTPPPGTAATQTTRCDTATSGGHGGFISSYGRSGTGSSTGTADASARGGFGASGAAHAGE